MSRLESVNLAKEVPFLAKLTMKLARLYSSLAKIASKFARVSTNLAKLHSKLANGQSLEHLLSRREKTLRNNKTVPIRWELLIIDVVCVYLVVP